MKIQMDAKDIEKLLTAYCPQNVRQSEGKFWIRFGQKVYVLGHTDLTLSTEVEHRKLKGNLNCHLTNSGAEITVELK